jgi:hypothetical protein
MAVVEAVIIVVILIIYVKSRMAKYDDGTTETEMKDRSDTAMYESVDDVRFQRVEAYTENSGYGVEQTVMINPLTATGDTKREVPNVS